MKWQRREETGRGCDGVVIFRWFCFPVGATATATARYRLLLGYRFPSCVPAKVPSYVKQKQVTLCDRNLCTSSRPKQWGCYMDVAGAPALLTT